jgi:hypothetical protein
MAAHAFNETRCARPRMRLRLSPLGGSGPLSFLTGLFEHHEFSQKPTGAFIAKFQNVNPFPFWPAADGFQDPWPETL